MLQGEHRVERGHERSPPIQDGHDVLLLAAALHLDAATHLSELGMCHYAPDARALQSDTSTRSRQSAGLFSGACLLHVRGAAVGSYFGRMFHAHRFRTLLITPTRDWHRYAL